MNDNANELNTDIVLLLAIVQKQDAGDLIAELVGFGYRVTRIDGEGGWLQQGNAVILVGTRADNTAEFFAAISRVCQTRLVMAPVPYLADPISGFGVPIEVEVGGAVVFALPVERYIQLTPNGIPDGQSVAS